MASHRLDGGRLTGEEDRILRNNGSTQCQICSQDLKQMSPAMQQIHYEEHFSQGSQPSATTAIQKGKGVRNKPSYRAAGVAGMKKLLRPQLTGRINTAPRPSNPNIFWYPAKTRPPPRNFNPGLIPVLKRALEKTHAKGQTVRAIMCYDRAVHIFSEPWDIGWGCGYRNYLMACAALMDQPFQPLYFPLLDADPAPGVRNLQVIIESAWKDGFDEQGAGQLKHKLLGTSKWIGTAELYVAFTYQGIPARLVEFEIKDGDVSVLTSWVQDYFTPKDRGVGHAIADALRGASPVFSTNRMPLVLQHAGHSRTIVGFELTKTKEVNLLIFDPSRKPVRQLREAGLASLYPQAFESMAPPDNDNKRGHISHAFYRAMHPFQRHRTKKRRTSGSARDNAIVIDSDVEEVPAPTRDAPPPPQRRQSAQTDNYLNDPNRVVNFFRLTPKQLARKQMYQILYFTLEDPLNEQQRLDRRTVFSAMADAN